MYKFRKIYNTKVDVLIVDRLLSDYIISCIPKSATVSVADNPARGVIPYVSSLTFFIKVVKNIFGFGLNKKALFVSIIDELEPKVVITFIDNNYLLGVLSKIYPKKKMISVQNGTRFDNVGNIGNGVDGYIFEDYYTFGLFEKDLYFSLGGVCSNHYPIGSLKLGIFLSNYDKPMIHKRPDIKTICFISQYRKKSPFLNDNFLTREFVDVSKQLYKLTVLFALDNGYEVVVSMVNQKNDSNYTNELDYFKEISNAGNIKLVDNNLIEMTSYKNAMCSDIIIGMDSTLMVEMFGCNKKVIWGSTFDIEFLRKRGSIAYKEKMPKEVMLNDLSKKSFNKKVSHLLNTDQKEYSKLISDSRYYFMNMNKDTGYPHEVIKNNIDKYLSTNG